MEIIWLPFLLGLVLLALRPLRRSPAACTAYTAASLALTCGLAVRRALSPGLSVTLGALADQLVIALEMDGLSRLFLILTAVLWLLCGVFAFGYLKGDPRAGWFYGVYLIVFGTMTGIACSANLVTLYLFFEALTLTSSLMVFYPCTHEAAMAGLKYLFYSIGGAFLSLTGIFFFYRMSEGGLFFEPGGVTLYTGATGGEGVLLLLTFLMLAGVGAKAGMFPLHGWLPTAHPVAPAPASAVLSGLIAKAGVFYAIRIVYYIVGADRLRGTWVQYAWMTLALVTVFMGSMLAYMEPVLKKRLAYSTVSQVSYILYGLSLLTPMGLTGGLLQMVCHAVAKCGLFLSAGAFITQTGRTRVDELSGVGKAMPVTTGCFAAFSLSLVGIPPFSGFVSKWYLAQGAAGAGADPTAVAARLAHFGTKYMGDGWFFLIGPAVLLLSALLTAGYLFPPVVRGFFAPAKADTKEAPAVMALPLVLLAVLTLALGLFTEPLLDFLAPIAGAVL